MSGNKIRSFIEALESGKTLEAATKMAEISPATARLQFSKWKRANGEKAVAKVKTPLKTKAKKTKVVPTDEPVFDQEKANEATNNL